MNIYLCIYNAHLFLAFHISVLATLVNNVRPDLRERVNVADFVSFKVRFVFAKEI